MDFLKEILGEELFAQVADRINAYNGNEANQGKQIKIGNLGGGDYISKAKYDALMAQHDGRGVELEKANSLIEEFKKSAKGNEALQGRITDYETQIGQLQAQLAQTQIDAEIKVALLAAKATDVPYMTFCLKAKGDKLEIGEDGKIKGIDDMITGLKTQYPQHFEKAGSGVQVEANPLPTGEGGGTEPTSLADALRMKYESDN